MEDILELEKKNSYILPPKPIKLKKGEKLRDYSKKVNKYAPYGRDENDDAYFNIELREGQTFQDYVDEIDKLAPFGRDKNGIAHLFPRKHKNEISYRHDMDFGADHGNFYNSGLGWKLNPTIFIALILIAPSIIGIPILNLIYGTFDNFLASLEQEFTIAIPFLMLITILVLFIRYAKDNLESLIKPYGANSNSVRVLFNNELEFLKFSMQLSYDIYNMKWLYLGFFGFLLYQPLGLINIINPEHWANGQPANIPYIYSLITIPSSLLYGLMIVMIFSFIIAIFVGLFSLGNLSKDRSKLSITKYGNMIDRINETLIIAQKDKKKLVDINIPIDISGRTFYEFQRGNRKIGEFLFNIATILIVVCISAGILLWVVDSLNLLSSFFSGSLLIMDIIIFIFGLVALGIFILPQFTLHRFLKKFKYTLIDKFAVLNSRLEYLYFESFKNPSALNKIDEKWKNRQNLVDDMNFIKEKQNEVKNYGTWSYDFPEVMKLILVVASTLIPLILPFFGINI